MYKKITEFNFREIDRKFVLVKSLSKKFDNYGIKNLSNPFLGILYFDVDCGMTLRILGNPNDEMMQKEYTNNFATILRADCFEELEFELYNEKINDYGILKQLEGYYDYPDLIKTREIKELDEFRHSTFPDDVQVLIPFEKQPELLWARLINVTETNKLYIVALLNDSYIDDNLKKGTFIACKPIEIKEKKYLVIDGILEKKQ